MKKIIIVILFVTILWICSCEKIVNVQQDDNEAEEESCSCLVSYNTTYWEHYDGIQTYYGVEVEGTVSNIGESTIISTTIYWAVANYESYTHVHDDLEPGQSVSFYDIIYINSPGDYNNFSFDRVSCICE